MNINLTPESLHAARIADGAITVLIGMMVVLSLLILRQAMQMVQVLPTPISPVIRVVVSLYTIATILAFMLAIISFITT